GQKAIDAGEEIPLPLGISVAYYHVTRDIDVAHVSASINDNPLNSVDDYVSIDVTTHVNTGSLRLDAWIFPFLNVYGLVGGIDNTSEINANFNIGTNSISLRADGSFSGTATGVGTVLAAGYLDYFMTLDANWIYSDLGDQFDTRFSGQIYNARLGWKGKIKNHNTRIWLGATYWDTEREMSGSILTGGGAVQKINFKVVQKPVNPGNISIGTNYEFTKKINIVADYGFNFKDTHTVLISLNYRFH
ncbi:MAG: hypothetical protein KAU94_12680, partial [Verrucomicrobia bacterium]|nr:hypothetical protein [Verrucomicrobiota bacterium]